ncbi:MAG: hypothetical protein A2Y20_01725 [Firmicutes bacterium GWF2_51_9]|nr:hypothetical protein [Erysipelotrichaceae bacterium]OGS53551.1 MAG: hypothetical protein A2Y20_01725 [Firmicutes bacterium GWF2_51_9]OGS58618.1 MAG: hypothetical protein A2Y19_07995 [Firmicutes bacterium GWE2_51_13]HAM62502.1 hypothetical protein [Erysipelotrichaceae bacterium]HBZ41836.1 hypothetical protein [Erysipelotrichaceae bacterium]
MLIKLIKHDLLATYREFTGLYVALISMAIVGPFVVSTRNEWLIAILFFGLFGFTIATLVVTFMTIIKLYSRRLFSDEGYLTLTLPVKTRDTIASKVATGVFWSFATIAVFFLSFTLFTTIFYFILTGTQWYYLSVDIATILGQISDTGIFKVLFNASLLGFPLSLMDTVYSMTLLLFIITLVNTSLIRKNRVAAGVALYLLASMILGSILSNLHGESILFTELILKLNDSSGFTDFTNALRAFNFTFNGMDYAITLVGKLIYIAGLGFGTHWLLENKLEIE